MQEEGSKAVLKIYYSRYLTNVRELSEASVRHYFDALNNISRRLKDKGIVENDVYEIRSLDKLYCARDILFKDADFIDLNRRGNQMYSAALNNYCRFAEGDGFSSQSNFIMKMDTVMKKEKPVMIEQKLWPRSDIVRAQAIKAADYKCEIDGHHQTFIADATKEPYMEGHHAIPMKNQEFFQNSLDIYANIVCLCPVCHRKIHYGLENEKRYMLQTIYDTRVDRLEKSGIKLSEVEFVEIGMR